jgi:two-component system CheB/CheR fusion protein
MPARDPAMADTARQQPRASPAPNFAAARPEGVCVVGVGASAGGLDACKRFLKALPDAPGMVFILVQHLDPTHASMLVELLQEATPMRVVEATDGMGLEANHLYVIPPGVYLSVKAGTLHLSAPREPRGARLPFDFLLNSLAASVGERTVCVILSGTGADGSVGLRAVKAAGGLVIVQAPADAEYDGMPRSAIASGQVDLVLPVDEIAQALQKYRDTLDAPLLQDGLTQITELLRMKTPHDFTLYKPGTLERRIARRMGIAGLAADDIAGYLKILNDDEKERDHLVADLLINVTNFFRDPKIFDTLAAIIIPELMTNVEKPVRVWVAGCSSGEETYSLAMLFHEHHKIGNTGLKLQIFASDVDAEAVAIAREGFYPLTIEAHVSAARLTRFFSKEENGYRVSPELRNHIIFAVQDVLAAPPFSKLDFISCRNLMIYLRPQAQAKVISIFNFALRKNGILLLGSAEAVGPPDGRFAVISKPARLYRKIASGGMADLTVPTSEADSLRAATRLGSERLAPRSADIAEFCKRLVLEAYAPVAILINLRLECLYSFGPTEQYLRVAPGYPTHDLLAMMRPALRARVKTAIGEATKNNARIVVPGGRVVRAGQSTPFNIDVKPVTQDGEPLLLICFVDQPEPNRRPSTSMQPNDPASVSELEHELAAVKRDLQAALQSVEMSTQEQNAINEEALSVNEEYQSTNEELLTSKEELQSLNEELTALNSQLQETLERSRMTSNDLQNVLYSTDVATLFLDPNLNIRFFTPATRLLFTLIPGDVGRPLADLHSLAADDALLDDARRVLANFAPIEREVLTVDGTWFNRRILPYRTHDDRVAGVVITFTDITDRKNISMSLQAAQRSAEQANIAKSRFLAAASHDLRQPMQTLTLLNALLAKVVDGSRAKGLLKKLDDATTAMTGILNSLLDINQIDSGIIQPEFEDFPIGVLLHKLGEEFAEVAAAGGLLLRVVSSRLYIRTDPKILEQMLRNLLSNALKYTTVGTVLMGCRRRGAMLLIEIWDTGIGIPQAELAAIFDEYHQVDNIARERSLGLGLGLSIVQRLGNLLGHKVSVRSVHKKGSVFAVEAALAAAPSALAPLPQVAEHDVTLPQAKLGKILVIEDDPDIRQLLELFLTEEGHKVAVARDGAAAVTLMASSVMVPDIILADYNLPNGFNGLQIAAKLRDMLGRLVPVVIITGDISSETMRTIAHAACLQMNKPIKLMELNEVIQGLFDSGAPLLAVTAPATSGLTHDVPGNIYVVDDDPSIRDSMQAVFEAEGRHVEVFADGEAFIQAHPVDRQGCVLVDGRLPGMSGLELLEALRTTYPQLGAVMITGQGDVKMAVQAMRAGALDFIEKPVRHDELLACVNRAFEQPTDIVQSTERRDDAAARIGLLTARQHQIMDRVLSGQASKNIAADLGISQRTVENHRASIMQKTNTRSIPELVRLALTAG